MSGSASCAWKGANIEPVSLPARNAGTTPARRAWRLEPFASLDGTVRADITDAAWVFDADVTVPISPRARRLRPGGRSSTSAPTRRWGSTAPAIYVDAPNGRTYLYRLAAATVAGATYGPQGRLAARLGGADRSRCSRSSSRCCPACRSARSPRESGEMLARTRIDAELRSGRRRGSATIAFASRSTGRGQGKNRIALFVVAVGARARRPPARRRRPRVDVRVPTRDDLHRQRCRRR
jgi:hypothetical protein